MSTDHPTQDVLLAFLRDELPKAEANTVALHLGDCETCVTSLAQTPAHRQLEQLLAASPTADIAADVQAVSPWLQHLKTLRPTPGDTASDQTMGFLEPPTSPGDLGRLGRYRVLAELGAGGMGRVFKAQHPVMERIVALKVISPRRMSDPACVTRFRREVKAVARLQHPNIVAAYDADEAGGVHFLVMEYVDGVTLAELLRKRKRLSVREAARVIRQAALGLQYAHEQGMVHRDLKPSNLMVTGKGTVKIMDLGLARIVDEAAAEPSVTSDHTALGTPDYMAPEQARDAHSADARSDIYSLGATLYHLLAGVVPFPEGSAFERLMIRQTRDPQPLREVAPDVPPELADVVAKMMCRDPDGRYQTPAEVAQALVPFTRPGAEERSQTDANQPTPAARAASPGIAQRSNVWWRRKALVLTSSAAIVLLGVVIYIQTDRGTVKIEPSNPKAQVEVKVDGQLVHVTSADEASRKSSAVKPQRDDVPVVRSSQNIASTWLADALREGRISAPDLRKLKQLLHDDFDDVESGFLRGEAVAGGGFRAQRDYENGKYFIRHPSGIGYTFWLCPPCQQLTNFVCRVDGRVTGPPNNQWMLLIQAEAERRNWAYLISLSGEGQLEMMPQPNADDASRGPRIGPLTHPAINKGDEFNSLLVVVRGRRIEVYVNDTAVCDPVTLGSAITPSSLCLCFQGGGRPEFQAEFDRLTVWSGDGLPTPEERMAKGEVASVGEIGRFDGHSMGVRSLRLSPDGRKAVSASEAEVWLWDLATQQRTRYFPVRNVYALAVAPDGQRALFGDASGAVMLWDLESTRQLVAYRKHASEIHSLAFSPDGKRFLSADGGEVTRLWDVKTREVLHTLQGRVSRSGSD